MFTKFIKRLVKDYVDSRIGNVEYSVKSLGEKVEGLKGDIFLKEKENETVTFLRFMPWYSSTPTKQSLEQRIKDMELKMEALEKHLKVSINFESTEGFKVRKQNQKKQ